MNGPHPRRCSGAPSLFTPCCAVPVRTGDPAPDPVTLPLIPGRVYLKQPKHPTLSPSPQTIDHRKLFSCPNLPHQNPFSFHTRHIHHNGSHRKRHLQDHSCRHPAAFGRVPGAWLRCRPAHQHPVDVSGLPARHHPCSLHHLEVLGGAVVTNGTGP